MKLDNLTVRYFNYRLIGLVSYLDRMGLRLEYGNFDYRLVLSQSVIKLVSYPDRIGLRLVWSVHK